jgi:hypothetical protein
MPERVTSFAPILPCVFLVLAAMIAVEFVSPVRGEGACIEQPAPKAAEGTHWSARYDRAKDRKCWFLVDANGRDVTASPAAPSSAATATVESISSQIASLFGSLTAAVAENAIPRSVPGDAGQTAAPHKPRGNGANASKADNAARGEHKSAGEGRDAVKRVSPALTEPEREALFEEFLRWQEIQRTIGASGHSPSSP